MSQLGVREVLGTSGVYPVGAKDAAEHPKMPPTTKNYPAPNVKSVKVKKPWTKLISFPLLKVLPD